MPLKGTLALAALVAVGMVGSPEVERPAVSGVERQPPATEVFVAALSARSSPPVHGPVVNISNSPGYDNQPGFLPDGSGVLFSSNRDGAQMDIYRYDFATKALSQVTRTPESEYSPTVAPDRATFTVIRQDAEGTQLLWRYNLDGTDGRVVLPDVKPVGYHAWADQNHVLLFILGGAGAPATLRFADTTTGMANVVESSIGRSIVNRPGHGTISFVSKPASGHWLVKEFDPATGAVATIAETVDDNVSEDTAWDPVSGWLLMGRGSQVWAWQAVGGWRLLGDLGEFGVGRITRLAVNPNPNAETAQRLVVVAEPVSR
jgi:hypothetical protein